MVHKKLVFVVVAGLHAGSLFAQSDAVSISGVLRTGYERFQIKDANTAVRGAGTTFGREDRISDGSSMLIFRGEENLGGNTKAWFQIDNRFAPDAGTFTAKGNTGVGLTGNWGKFTLGRWDLYYHDFNATHIEDYRGGNVGNLAGVGIMSQVNGAPIAVGTRSSNVVLYNSPSFNGFSALAAYSTNPVDNEGSGLANGSAGGAYTARIAYANGPFSAVLSTWVHNVEGRAANALDERSSRIGATYAFPFGLKVGLGVDRSGIDHFNGVNVAPGPGGVTSIRPGVAANGMARRTAWMLPVSYHFGSHAVYLTYVRAGSLNTVSSSGARFMTLGYDYALSKRTIVGAFYSRVANDTSGTYTFFAPVTRGESLPTAGGETATQLYLGITHFF